MKRTLLAALASLALAGGATAADADGYGRPPPDPAWGDGPPRYEGPRYEEPRYDGPRYGDPRFQRGDVETDDVIVRRPPARIVERERIENGTVVHERIVIERTIRPARSHEPERTDWYEDEGPRPPRPIGLGAPVYPQPAYDPEPVVLARPVTVGAFIPPTVVLRPVPSRYGHAGYHWVGDPYGRRVLVEPGSRRVVRIVDRW